jgi:hypothetical protein
VRKGFKPERFKTLMKKRRIFLFSTKFVFALLKFSKPLSKRVFVPFSKKTDVAEKIAKQTN